jgi:hypothetical protein
MANQSAPTINSIRSRSVAAQSMQVTQEDGGRLNAFAKEPRMEVISDGASLSNGSRLLITSGAVLVIALMALSVAVS